MPEHTFSPPPDDEELYELLNLGLALYAAGKPFEAHEVWEYAWKVEVGRTKLTLQAMIQIAAALYKHEVGVPGGTCKLLAKAGDKIDEIRTGAAAWLGIDLVDLRQQVTRSLAEADAVINGSGEHVTPPGLPSNSGPDGILYLHGFASSPGSKKVGLIARPLQEQGFHVNIPDLNEGDFAGLTITRAVELARRHVRDRTIVIGSSLGGYIGSLLAARDDRIKALVLMAPAFDFGHQLDAHHGDDIHRWRREGTVQVEHHGTGAMEPLRFDFREDARTHAPWPPLRVPTYIVHGTRDDVVRPSASIEAARRHPDLVELHLVDDDHTLVESAERALSASMRMIEQLRFRARSAPIAAADAIARTEADPRFD